MDRLNIYFNEIKLVYEENCKLKKNNDINIEENKNYQLEIEKLKNEIHLLKTKSEKKEMITKTVSLWENTQLIINEKDKEIEYLKKQLEFYDRSNSIKNKKNLIKNDIIINTEKYIPEILNITCEISTIKDDIIKNEVVEIKDENYINQKIQNKKNIKKKKIKKEIMLEENENDIDLEKELEKELEKDHIK